MPSQCLAIQQMEIAWHTKGAYVWTLKNPDEHEFFLLSAKSSPVWGAGLEIAVYAPFEPDGVIEVQSIRHPPGPQLEHGFCISIGTNFQLGSNIMSPD